jgi:hypothetical protein
MITALLCWMYVTLICLVWGSIFIKVLAKKFIVISDKTEFSIVCLAGLSVVGVIAFYLSIFIPLDWKAHCIILFPVLIYCLAEKNRNNLKQQIVSAFKSFSIHAYSLLSVCILMTLIISADKIIHPDTLAYHAQSVLWFQKYKAVPGIVHLRLELGFQSFWFASQAIFNPAGNRINFFFLGGCVVSWYLIFVIKKIDALFFKQHFITTESGNLKWGWLLLLIYSLLSWTQVRLTTASASPDFIVSLLILAAIYIFYQSSSDRINKKSYFVLAAIFSCVAFITKLSSVAIILLPLITIIYFLFHKNFKGAAFISVIAGIIIIPLFVRNFIASGYLFYPSSYPDFFSPDWKLKIADAHKLQQYISAYARYPVAFDEADKNLHLSFKEWIPVWWKHLVTADQILLCITGATGILNIIFFKSLLKKLNDKYFAVIFFIAFSGSLLWFIKAPDPRFGTGFLIALIYALYLPLREKTDSLVNKIKPLAYKGATWLLILIISAYSFYRLYTFFKPAEIFYPAGIEKVNYTEIDYNKIKINLVTDSTGCGLTPVPCITDSSQNFIPRGEMITDGFKEK